MIPPRPAEVPEIFRKGQALARDGDHAGALAAFRRILLLRPDTAEVWFQIGLVEAARGDKTAAETALRRAMDLKPNEPAIWQALYAQLVGRAAKTLEKEAARAKIPLGSEAELRPVLAQIAKDPAKAEAAALAAVKRAPEAAWPAFALGRARAAQKAWGRAVSPLQVAHDRDPTIPGLAFSLGQCRTRLGQYAAAEPLLRPLVEGSFAARLELAALLASVQRLDEAAELLRTGAPKASAPRETYALLAEIEAKRGDQAGALRAIPWALKAGYTPVMLFRRVAHAFEESGATTAASETIESGLARIGRDPGLLTHKATLLQSSGDFAAADDALAEALTLDPTRGEAYRAYVGGRRVAAEDPVVGTLEELTARVSLPRSERRILGFAAGKAAFDTGQKKRGFDHLVRANRLMLQDFPYRFEEDLAEAQRLVSDWSAMRSLNPSGPTEPVLFVTGLPRSGTTLVETILAAHSDVCAGGEMPFLNRVLAPVMERMRAGNPDEAAFAEAGAAYLVAGQRRAGGALFTDKAISVFSRIGHAVTALPGARVVVVERDHRDTGLSMFRNMFPEGTHRYTTDLAAMGRYMRLHDALIAYWSQVLPDKIHRVSYEALVSDPEPHIRELVAFAGLPWDSACLAPERSGRRVQTLSFTQVRSPIGRQSVEGWRAFETELAPLLRSLAETQIDLQV